MSLYAVELCGLIRGFIDWSSESKINNPVSTGYIYNDIWNGLAEIARHSEDHNSCDLGAECLQSVVSDFFNHGGILSPFGFLAYLTISYMW